MEYYFSKDKLEKICNHYNRTLSELDDWEVYELIDNIIEEATMFDIVVKYNKW